MTDYRIKSKRPVIVRTSTVHSHLFVFVSSGLFTETPTLKQLWNQKGRFVDERWGGLGGGWSAEETGATTMKLTGTWRETLIGSLRSGEIHGVSTVQILPLLTWPLPPPTPFFYSSSFSKSCDGSPIRINDCSGSFVRFCFSERKATILRGWQQNQSWLTAAER